MPWQTDSSKGDAARQDFKYQYHPGGDPRNPPKDAPSALHSVIVPNVNLPKVWLILHVFDNTTSKARILHLIWEECHWTLMDHLPSLQVYANILSPGVTWEIQQVGQGWILDQKNKYRIWCGGCQNTRSCTYVEGVIWCIELSIVRPRNTLLERCDSRYSRLCWMEPSEMLKSPKSNSFV